jgi:hypothetical protein
MERESLAVVKNLRLMDDTFMSKCLENAPECIELILQIILDKKDLKVVKSQTEYPIKSLQGRGVRFDVFARDSKGKEYDIEIQRENDGAEPKRARYNSALQIRHWQVDARFPVQQRSVNVFRHSKEAS